MESSLGFVLLFFTSSPPPLPRKTPLLETMTSAADILKGDGQEAFDREWLT